MEGLRKVDGTVSAFIHPSRAGNVEQGMHEILNALLLRFNKDFDGVILAYLRPKLVGRTAKVLSGLDPYFRVSLATELLIFSPVPGKMIEGKVNKVEKDYIGVLVLGIFNATIGADDIRDDLDFSTEHHSGRAWMSNSDPRHAIALGSSIRFTVKSLQQSDSIIDMCGSLTDDNTGCVDWLDQHFFRSRGKRSKEGKLRSSEDKKNKKSKRKRESYGQDLRKHSEELQQTFPTAVNETMTADLEEQPKRKKKRRHESG